MSWPKESKRSRKNTRRELVRMGLTNGLVTEAKPSFSNLLTSKEKQVQALPLKKRKRRVTSLKLLSRQVLVLISKEQSLKLWSQDLGLRKSREMLVKLSKCLITPTSTLTREER